MINVNQNKFSAGRQQQPAVSPQLNECFKVWSSADIPASGITKYYLLYLMFELLLQTLTNQRFSVCQFSACIVSKYSQQLSRYINSISIISNHKFKKERRLTKKIKIYHSTRAKISALFFRIHYRR